MLVYHKKNSYFVPDEDANLIPMGSYVLKDNEMIYIDNLDEMVSPPVVEDKEEIQGPTGETEDVVEEDAEF